MLYRYDIKNFEGKKVYFSKTNESTEFLFKRFISGQFPRPHGSKDEYKLASLSHRTLQEMRNRKVQYTILYRVIYDTPVHYTKYAN